MVDCNAVGTSDGASEGVEFLKDGNEFTTSDGSKPWKGLGMEGGKDVGNGHGSKLGRWSGKEDSKSETPNGTDVGCACVICDGDDA